MWHTDWGSIGGVGLFCLAVLAALSDGLSAMSEYSRVEAEKRGRERIMESYDKYDRREDN